MLKYCRLILTILLASLTGYTLSQQPEQTENPRFICVSPYKLPGGPVRFFEDRHNRLIITIKGKEGLIGIVKDTNIEPIVKGFVADATPGADGTIWYFGQKQVNSINPSDINSSRNLTPLFFKDKIPNKTTRFDMPLFYRDRLGRIWLSDAPFLVGADMMSLPNLSVKSFKVMSPVPQTTDPFGNMWGLIPTDDKDAKAVVVITHDKPDSWAVFDKSNGFPVDQWNSVIADIEGFIWVSGKAGLTYFDPRKPNNGWRTYPLTGLYTGGAVSALALSPTGHALAALQSGGIYEVDIDKQGVPIVRPVVTEGLPKLPVNALYTDRQGRIWLVAEYKLYRQDKQPSAWQTLTSMPYGNHDVSGVELNGKIYIPGGGASHGLPVAVRNFDCLMIYDINNDHWELSPPMSINRRYCSVGLLDSKVWVIGGFNRIGERVGNGWNDTPVNTVEIYDPISGKWSSGPELDVPRAGTVTLYMAGRLYVFGGNGIADNGKEKFNTLSIAPNEKAWRLEPATPYPVLQTTGCVYNNQAYMMIGGVGLIMYDPVTQTWQKDFSPIPGSKAPRASALATFKNKIWVISGTDVDNETNVWIYSPDEQVWTKGPSFPYSTLWADGIEVNCSLYVFGGATFSKIHNCYVFWDAIRILQ